MTLKTNTPDSLAGSSASLNVRDFGAIGDGATDDTTAFQAAINALTASGGVVYMPAGEYLITTALTLPNKVVTFQGAGSGVTTGATQITFTGPTALFTVSGAASYFYFRDVFVEGDSSTGQILFNATGNGLGIQTEHFNSVGIEIGLKVATGVFCYWYAFDTSIQVPAIATSYHADTVDSGGAYIQAIGCYFMVAGNVETGGGMNGNVGLEAFNTIFYGGNAFEIGAVYITNSTFYYSEVDVNIYPHPRFTTCSFLTKKTGQDRWIDITSVDCIGAIVQGCSFNGTLDNEDVRTAAKGGAFMGNTKVAGGAPARIKVLETGTADYNRYEGIDAASTIIGANSKTVAYV